MKKKLFLLLCALLTSVGMWADTDCTNKVATGGWKLTDGTTTAGPTDTKFAPAVNVGGSSVQMRENYNATNTAATGILLQQTVSGLTNGIYKVEFYANAMHANNVTQSASAYTNARVYVFANTQYKQVTPEEKNSTAQNGEYTINNVEVKDGTLKLGLYKHSAGTNWHTIQIKSLTLLSDALATNSSGLVNASESSPIDATDFLPVSVITNSSATGWAFTGSGRNYSAGVWEVYNQNYTLQQTLSNMPNGRYVVKVQGFYRAGGGGATSTAQNVRLFANSVNSNVLNILSDSYDSQPGTGAWSQVNNKYVPNDRAAGGYAFFMGEKYKNNSVTAYVTNNTLNLGLTKGTAVTNDWSLFNCFEIKCTGIYVSAVAKEFISGSTMEANQWYKYTVPTDGDYSLSVTSGIVYSITDAIASDTHSNVSSTIALPAGTVYFKSTTSQALTISYVDPVIANGDYYLYDATNKVFLSRGNNYGTEAAVDKYGVPFTYNNYEKSIRFKDLTDNGMFYNGSQYYTDGTAGRFIFEETTGGLFLYDQTNSKYIKHATSVETAFSGNSLAQATSASDAVVWTIMTKAERDAIVNAYPTNNKTNVIAAASLTSETDAAGFEAWLAANRAAKDYTSHVGTAKFDGNKGSWAWHETLRKRDGQPAYGTDFAELFSMTGCFDQTIGSLPKGLYKVTVNAFERDKGYADCNTLGAAGWEIVTAYFEANGQAVQLKSWYSEKTGTSNPNSTGEAATAFNNDKYKNEIYCYVGDDGELTLKLAKPSYIWDSWVLFNNVTLTYYDENVSDEDATAILDEATTTMGSPMKASLYQALSNAKSTFDGARTVPNYNALRAAIDNTATSIASYANMYTNYIYPLNTYLATTNFVDQTSDAYTTYEGYKAAYDNYTDAETADVENATANALNWKSNDRYVAPINKIMMVSWKIGNTNALTNNSGFYMNTWSGESAGSGDAKDFANPFYEYWVSSGSLAATILTGTLTGLNNNTIYKVTANVRVQGTNEKVAKSITMQVGDGAGADVTEGSKIGDTNRYIGSYSAVGMTDNDGNMTLTFNVAGSSNISWLSFRDVNFEEVTEVADAKNYLNARISAANALSTKYEDNVGEGVFQIPTDAATTFSGAITTAQDVYDNGSATFDDVFSAATSLNAAIEDYETVELNAPEGGKRYRIVLSNNGGWTYDGKAITYLANARNDMGNYNVQYLAAPNANYAQAIIFTQVEGNTYKMSQIDVDGNTRYLCTGVPYSGNTSQIRTTTDASKALVVKIEATSTANIFNIYNTEANQYIGSQDAGVYTVNNHKNFTIEEASKATAKMVISAIAKLGTFCAPFDVTIPADVKAYTVTKDAEKDYVTLTDVETTIAAGTPVLVEYTGSGSDPINEEFTDFATKNNAESEVFKGVFAKEKVAKDDNNYILQYQDGVCAFYIVKSDDIYVGANRCYLHVVDGSSLARIVIGGGDDPTAINAIEAATPEANTLKDGKYLINGKVVLVKNGVKYSTNGQKLN